MTVIDKAGIPSLSSYLPPQNTIIASGIRASEDIEAGDVCYINSDGEAVLSDGTSLAPAAKARGIAARDATEGEAVTLFRGIEMHYGSGLTPGIDLFVATTPGALDDTATTGGIAPVAFTVDAERIFFHGSHY